MECEVECCHFENFGNPWKSKNPSQPFSEIQKSWPNLHQIPKSRSIFFGISEILEISYAILGSEMPLIVSKLSFYNSIHFYPLPSILVGRKVIPISPRILTGTDL